ncbi:MAG: DUF4214 domain-containing protein [Gammaproteobacteria bacterium]
MATLNDITNPPVSGLNHIDALLDEGPNWNFLGIGGNTITYTFSTSSNMEAANGNYTGVASGLSSTQQASARSALAYLTSVTGVQFVESSNGAAAQLHFANADLAASANTAGLCSWSARYLHNGSTDEVTQYAPNVYVYLDNAEFRNYNATLTPGTGGYETLLHELGHAMGLKHPFEQSPVLPSGQDNTALTLMSYKNVGGPYSTYQAYDLAALNWLYGGDGLGGALGIGSATGARYLTGSSASETLTGTQSNDILQGEGGNDMIYGGAGTDTAVFNGLRSNYQFQLNGTNLEVRGTDGFDTLNSIEVLRFADGSVSAALVLDTTPPAAPEADLTVNDAGFISGDTPLFAGRAEANSTVRLYSGTKLIGTVVTNTKGLWLTATDALPDGHYTVTATATDAAGNVSAPSKPVEFKIDTVGPVTPEGSVKLATPGSNQPEFSGKGEAGSLIILTQEINGVETPIAQTTVDANGAWKLASNPLINGEYNVTVHSVDTADNFANATAPLHFTIASDLNRVGTAQADKLTGTAGNNAIDGGAGIDTVSYEGVRANFKVVKSVHGFTVTGPNSGTDSLVNVERIHFGDTEYALDIDGHAGQAYRMFAAALDRAPLAGGLGFWTYALDSGQTLEQIATQFINSAQFKTKYGANLSNSEFVTTLFQHVLHRAPKEAGLNFWTSALDQGVDRAHVLAQFSESAENKLQVIGKIENGIEFTLWHA